MDPSIKPARNAVNKLIGLKWGAVQYGLLYENSHVGTKYKPNTLEYNLTQLKCIQNAKGSPVLLFIESKEMKKISKSSKKKPKPTTANERSKKAFKVFGAENMKQVISGMTFKCLRMDITKISENENRKLNRKNAPYLAFYTSKGVLCKVLSGSSAANERSVYSAMCETAKVEKIDLPKLVKMVTSELNNLFKNEKKLYYAKKDLEKVQKEYGKKKTKLNQSKLTKVEKKYKDLQQISDGIRKKVLSIFTTQGQQKGKA